MSYIHAMNEPDGLIFEKIFGPDILKHHPGLADAELQFSLDGLNDRTAGFDPLGPDRERLFAWVREGKGHAFQVAPVRTDLQRALDMLPDGWEHDRTFHPAAEKVAATIRAGYEIPADLDVLILEEKGIWISLRHGS